MSRPRPRRGMALVLVLLVVALLGLAGYDFALAMLVEHKAARLRADQARAEELAASGMSLAQSLLELSRAARRQAGGMRDNPNMLAEAPIDAPLDRAAAARVGSASVLRPSTARDERPKYGLDDESARLNLVALLEWDSARPGTAHTSLMALPGMTDSIADAILDWIDADSAPRPFGAENDHYAGLDPPYAPRNGLPETIEELLLVKGVTRELLLGEPSSQSPAGAARLAARTPQPMHGTSADGAHVAWADLLTLHSAERNESDEGRTRVFLNDPDLARLHGLLTTAIAPEWADFIVAWRQFGPYADDSPGRSASELSIDVSLPARFSFGSLLDLIDAKVRIGSGETAVFESPLAENSASASDALARLANRTTLDRRNIIAGRVNVDEAPLGVLLAVPGMPEPLARQIVSSRESRAGAVETGQPREPTWLLTERLANLDQLKSLLPYLTCGGDVARAHVVGHVDGDVFSAHVEVVIDAARRPARIVARRDLRAFDYQRPSILPPARAAGSVPRRP